MGYSDNRILFQNGSSFKLPRAYQNLGKEAIEAMTVKIVIKTFNGLKTIEFKDSHDAVYSVYGDQVRGTAMADRDRDGNPCLRFESLEAYSEISK